MLDLMVVDITVFSYLLVDESVQLKCVLKNAKGGSQAGHIPVRSQLCDFTSHILQFRNLLFKPARHTVDSAARINHLWAMHQLYSILHHISLQWSATFLYRPTIEHLHSTHLPATNTVMELQAIIQDRSGRIMAINWPDSRAGLVSVAHSAAFGAGEGVDGHVDDGRFPRSERFLQRRFELVGIADKIAFASESFHD